jgi:hypothetical protein
MKVKRGTTSMPQYIGAAGLEGESVRPLRQPFEQDRYDQSHGHNCENVDAPTLISIHSRCRSTRTRRLCDGKPKRLEQLTDSLEQFPGVYCDNCRRCDQ